MIAKINYSEIKNLNPTDAFELIQGIKKGHVKDAKMSDIVNTNSLEKKIHEFSFVDLSFRGVYMFFDSNGNAKYIGQTNDSFYQRLPTQLDTWFYNGFGWNSMLRIMGGIRTGKQHYQLTEEDHEEDLKEVLTWNLLLVVVDRTEPVDAYKLMWIEKVLLKTYRKIQNNTLINGRIGWLNENQWKMSVHEIINS